MKMIKFKTYSDAGHGWIAVKRKLLIELKIDKEITRFSYQKGGTVYLEEDCDATTLIEKLKELSIDYILVQGKYQNYSTIRSYQSYTFKG